MSQPLVFIGGSRHLTPGTGYSTPTMSVVKAGQGLPPYEVERYLRTELRVEIPGEITGPAVVFVLDGFSYDRGELVQALAVWAADPRVAEHFRFTRTREGRSWERSA